MPKIKLPILPGILLIIGLPATYAQSVSFEADVLPIFEKRCSECHANDDAEARLVLISYEDVMAGSEYGIVVSPGNPLNSYLIEMVESGEMPQDGDPVTLDELTLIRRWIEEGAQNN